MKNFAFGMLAAVAMTGLAFAADMAPRYTKAPAPLPIVVYALDRLLHRRQRRRWLGTDQRRPQIGKRRWAGIVPQHDFGSSTGSDFVGGGSDRLRLSVRQHLGDRHPGHVRLRPDRQFTHHAWRSRRSTATSASRTCGRSRAALVICSRPQLLGYVKGGGAWTRPTTSSMASVRPRSTRKRVRRNRSRLHRRCWPRMDVRQGLVGVRRIQLHGLRQQGREFRCGTRHGRHADVVRTKLDVEQFLVGVNYKFNCGQPVVARY